MQLLKKLSQAQRFRNRSKNKSTAEKAGRKIKTIAERLVRELKRKHTAGSNYQADLELFSQILNQKKESKGKVYSIQEPEEVCVSKGEEHKEYEFGDKVSVTKAYRGVIVGALVFRYGCDGHTLEPMLKLVEPLKGRMFWKIKVDRVTGGINQ